MNNDNIIIIYHNPRWGKSRKSVQILDENNKEYQIIEYLKNPLTIKELKALGGKLKFRPSEFIRKGEQIFKDLNLLDKLNNDNELYQKISEHPKLMERPIIVNGEDAIIGRPPENIFKII